ncbi:hypothetical protein Pmani_015391 [Petrolisthes manimaculis]|uniref:Ionotropic glutamate receptor L-glutamate and glycine-binding domain-containing protein n=1 Tax=Petrolisthes manimaculis TaxID=1843537 RepID=A0AAE1PTS1_9EUCA|nr:hypothetical protein Pmani_015391 [Petrolisthes manimaculis]
MEGVILSSLVLFLLQPSQHTEVIIIHDYTLPGVKELAESFSERWVATTILTATPAPDLSQLLVALTSFHTNDLRYMVLLCSANTTWTVFDMVSRYNLESRRVRWLVLGEEGKLSDPIIHNIREGSLVGLIAPVNSYLFKILLSFVNQENQEVGVWRGRSGEKGKNSLDHPHFPDLVNLYRNFQGRQLVVSALDNWPFFGLKYLDNGTVVIDSGIDISIMNTLGYYLNFTYQVQVPADHQWGAVLEDGTVTGMVGEVVARRAHFTINQLTITGNHTCSDIHARIIHHYSRETVVDFSQPYFTDSTTITSKAPEEKNRSLAVFYPFSPILWIILALVTLLMGPLGYLFSRVHHQLTQTFDSTHNERSRNVGPSFDSGRIKWGSEPGLRGVEMFCFNMFRTIIIQGNLLPASSWPLRLVFFSWYAFCLIMYAVYAGTLTAYLTKPSFDETIDSLEDLLAARDRGVVAVVTVGTSNEVMLKVVEKNTAYISERMASEIYALKYLGDGFYVARDNFLPQSFGIACPSGAPYISTLNVMLGRMVQAGLVGKWSKDEVAKIKKISDQGEKESQGKSGNVGQDGLAAKPLALDHLQV